MKNPLNITVKDLALLISDLEDKGVALQMTFVPIKKDDNKTEKGGVQE